MLITAQVNVTEEKVAWMFNSKIGSYSSNLNARGVLNSDTANILALDLTDYQYLSSSGNSDGKGHLTVGGNSIELELADSLSSYAFSIASTVPTDRIVDALHRRFRLGKDISWGILQSNEFDASFNVKLVSQALNFQVYTVYNVDHASFVLREELTDYFVGACSKYGLSTTNSVAFIGLDKVISVSTSSSSAILSSVIVVSGSGSRSGNPNLYRRPAVAAQRRRRPRGGAPRRRGRRRRQGSKSRPPPPPPPRA
jgi:hypothetical protein